MLLSLLFLKKTEQPSNCPPFEQSALYLSVSFSFGSNIVESLASEGLSKLNIISIYGVSELDICHTEAKVGFRSNPSSPYKKVSTMNSKLEEITKKERGIDHDFLFSVPKENSYRKDRLIVRFKNHKVAVDFAGVIDLFSSTCKN